MMGQLLFHTWRKVIVGILLSVGLWFNTSSAIAAEPEAFVFRENVEYAPYLYRHTNASGQATGVPQGYIPTLLKYLMDDHGIDIEFKVVPRNRVEATYEKGGLDGSILSRHWVSNPDEFVFSTPLALYRSVLFTSDMEQGELIPLAQLKNQYICARRGYKYPELDQLWEANNLIRVDFSDELLQLKGLVAERCQYAVMDEAIGRWYIGKQFKDHTFSIVSEESRVPLTLGFRKHNAAVMDKFNSTISRLKANGELAILQRVFKVIPYQDPQYQSDSP